MATDHFDMGNDGPGDDHLYVDDPAHGDGDGDGDPAWDHDLACGSPWAFKDPLRNRTAIPYTDDDTICLVDEAVKSLTIFRAGELGDAGATVSVLVSLIAEADYQLYDAVAAARDRGYTWDEIASRLAASSAASAARRYRAYTAWKRTQPLDSD